MAAGIAERFNAGIETANNAVKEKQQADPNLSEMGCTLVAALVVGSTLYWTSVRRFHSVAVQAGPPAKAECGIIP